MSMFGLLEGTKLWPNTHYWESQDRPDIVKEYMEGVARG